MNEPSELDRYALKQMSGKIVDSWENNENELMSREIICLSPTTAMSFKPEQMRSMLRIYANCGVKQLLNNEIALIGTEEQRLIAKCYLCDKRGDGRGNNRNSNGSGPTRVVWESKYKGDLLGKNGQRLKNIESLTMTCIDLNVLEKNSDTFELIIRGLPTFQEQALIKCGETKERKEFTIKSRNAASIVGSKGKGVAILQNVTNADIWINEIDGNNNNNNKHVRVCLAGTEYEKTRAMKEILKWEKGTKIMRETEHCVKFFNIPFDLTVDEAKKFVESRIETFCGDTNENKNNNNNNLIQRIDVIDKRHKKNKIYFAYVSLSDFNAKMKLLEAFSSGKRNANGKEDQFWIDDINSKFWNASPNPTAFIGKIDAKIAPGLVTQAVKKYFVSKYVRKHENEMDNIDYDFYDSFLTIKYDTRSKLGFYKAYIIFNSKFVSEREFYSMCNFVNRIGVALSTNLLTVIMSDKWKRENEMYKYDFQLYENEFDMYLEYLMKKNTIDNDGYYTIDMVSQMFEKQFKLPWFQRQFRQKIYKLYCCDNLNPQIKLNKFEIKDAKRMYGATHESRFKDELKEEQHLRDKNQTSALF